MARSAVPLEGKWYRPMDEVAVSTPTGRGQATTQGILELVRLALDEIDSAPLAASVRRTVRVANLLGDSRSAVRMGLEVKASGGHPPANAEATRRLMVDPSSWGNPDGPAEQALMDYMTERTNRDGLVVSHSVAEIEFWQAERIPAEEMTNDQYGANLGHQLMFLEILTRVRHHAFTLLCSWERQLTFTANQESALDAVSMRVDALLNEQAPDVLNQFNAAFRRLREAANRDPEASANEELSQSLTSCRRILKAVVDVVQPADLGMPASADGHPLTDEHYKNRLVEFLKANVSSASFRSALAKGGETLFERFAAIDSISSKGVHARVAIEEAEYCALHTYLLAGEILLIRQDRG